VDRTASSWRKRSAPTAQRVIWREREVGVLSLLNNAMPAVLLTLLLLNFKAERRLAYSDVARDCCCV